MKVKVRLPIALGRFYPATKEALIDMLLQFSQQYKMRQIHDSEIIIGGIVPHAGFIYSGNHATTFFNEIENCNYDTIIILSPSHTGVGPSISIDCHTHWKTPLGLLSSDNDLIESKIFIKNTSTQEFEHATEVIIPFIQYFCPQTSKVAVVSMRDQSIENAKIVALGIKHYKETSNKHILVIASSDFNHFDSAEIGKEKDDHVIKKIISFDVMGVEKEIKKHNVSVCGYGPIMALMLYAKDISDKAECKILSRGNSGEIISSDSVVDYVSAAFLNPNN